MPAFLATSPVGDLCRFVTRQRWPHFAEDEEDFCARFEATTKERFDASGAEKRPEVSSRGILSAEPQSEESANVSRGTTLCDSARPADILVDWYGPDDPENPLNWSFAAKFWVSTSIGVATVSIYLGGATVSTAYNSLREDFGIGEQTVLLSMSLYIFCYGAGALLFSPLSELPSIGRNPPYYLPMTVALAVQLAGALSPSYGGVLACRALVGLLGAPLLATGGASLCDVWGIRRLPVALNWFWVLPSFCSPGTAPILTISAVERFGWRWAFWIQFFVMALGLILLLLTPETAAHNILYRRAARLRQTTGSAAFTTMGEAASRAVSTKTILFDALATPFKITLLDPSILFANCYIGFAYGVFFTFFDAFPIVYGEIFKFGTVPAQAVFVCVNVGAFVGGGIYTGYQVYYMMPFVSESGMPVVEQRLVPALWSAVAQPIGLFIFAWSSFAQLHWIGPAVGAALMVGANIVTFQCIFYYIILAYEDNAASCLAANDFIRSAIAAFLVHGATPLFHSSLGVHGGVSLLGGIACLGVPGVWYLYLRGDRLRAKSRFAVSEQKEVVHVA